MIIQPYASKVITLLVGVACAVFGILTFGNAYQFDVISTLFLVVVGFYCRHDINLLAVIAIIFSGRIAEEFIFYLTDESPLSQALIYVTCAACVFKLTRDRFRYSVTLVLITSLLAELYWYISNYDGPDLSWAFSQIVISLVIRYIFIYRPFLMRKYFNKNGNIILLDYSLQRVYGLPILVECLNITEYIVRHTTDYKPLYFYDIYPYLMHAINTYVIWVVLQYSQSLIQKKSLKA